MASRRGLIRIQTDYIDTVSAGMDRWSHRRDGGHSGRIREGAWRRAYKSLIAWQYTDEQARRIIADAHEQMMLERAAVDDELNHAS